PGRSYVDCDRGRVAVGGDPAGVREAVRVATVLRGQADRDGRGHGAVPSTSGGDRRALAAPRGRRGESGHPGRNGDAARGAGRPGPLRDPQHRPDRAGLRADRRAAAGPGGADRASRRQRSGGRAVGRSVMPDVTSRPPERPSASPPLLREAPIGDSAVPRMDLAEWAARYGLVAGITTRGHGFSLGLWSEENVGEVMWR